MSERFKEHDWKSCDAGMYPEVQILFSAPTKKDEISFSSFFVCITNFEEELRGELRARASILPRLAFPTK